MPGPSPKFDLGQAAELYTAGATLHDIGTRFGTSPPNLSRLLRKAGVAMRPSGPRPLAVNSATVVQLRDIERWTWQQIAADVGMSASGARHRYLNHTHPAGDNHPDHRTAT